MWQSEVPPLQRDEGTASTTVAPAALSVRVVLSTISSPRGTTPETKLTHYPQGRKVPSHAIRLRVDAITELERSIPPECLALLLGQVLAADRLGEPDLELVGKVHELARQRYAKKHPGAKVRRQAR